MESLLLRRTEEGLGLVAAAGVWHRLLLREHLVRAQVTKTYQKHSPIVM